MLKANYNSNKINSANSNSQIHRNFSSSNYYLNQVENNDGFYECNTNNNNNNNNKRSQSQYNLNTSDFFLDYYTCKEYNKKLLKKLDRLMKNNQNLKAKIKELNDNFDIELERKIKELIETKYFERKKHLITTEKELHNEKYENVPTNKTTKTNQKASKVNVTGNPGDLLMHKLFDAQTTGKIKTAGNDLVNSLDNILNTNYESIKNQNSYLFKKLDQLQRENERFRYLFEILETELS